MGVNLQRIVRLMKRPESMLAAGVVGLCSAVGVLVAVSMTSCDSGVFDLSKSSASEKAATKPSGAPTVAAKPYVRAPGEPEMRVRILTAVDRVKVGTSGSGGLKIARGEPKGMSSEPVGGVGGWGGAGVERVAGVGPVTIGSRGGAWTIAGGAAGTVEKSGATHPALLIAPAVPGEMLSINGAMFPGVLRLSMRSDVRDGAMDGVEFVPLEEYLSGVVAKEMLAGWPLEAYRVQAVAARTYAMQERERNLKSAGGGGSFDVESSDRDQVYAGATTNKTAIEAVRSTRGVVLMDGENILRAYFSSTCGGRVASARDTWPTGPGFEYNLAAPIQAHTPPRESACNASPLYRWTTERPRGELVVRLRTFGERNRLMVRQITDLAAIEPMSLNDVGRPNRYKIIEPGGRWFQLSAEELRLACNTNVSGNAVMATGGAPKSAAPGGGAGTPALAAVSVQPGSDGPPGVPSTMIPDIDRKTRVHSSDFEVKVVGETVIINGRGFGHGVGMCQYCAKAMADRGDNHRVMLMRFYPGAQIKNLY